MDLSAFGNIALLIFGFGFVIFWHELGHFIAAKWAGVRVEQFAIGFGQALFAWRKGIGVRVGTTTPEYERRAREHLKTKEGLGQAQAFAESQSEDYRLNLAAQEIGLGETEYRLNWVPLGGYVKMLGQDDMDPNALSPDPRAYNNKPVGKRMIIISAGVAMNVLLAAILFCVLFLMGFTAPSPLVGGVSAGSPAQKAGILPGDRIIRFDGSTMHDFTKVKLATALADPTEPSEIIVRRDGREIALKVKPIPDAASGGLMQIGVSPAAALQVPDNDDVRKYLADKTTPDELKKFRAGDCIVAVNGVALPAIETDKPPKVQSEANAISQRDARDQSWTIFQREVAASFGKSVTLTVRATDGTDRTVEVSPRLVPPFDGAVQFAGMQTRTQVGSITDDSAAREKLLPGDAVVRVSIDQTGDAVDHPTHEKFLGVVADAAARDSSITVTVQRGSERLTFDRIPLAVKIEQMTGPSRRGIGMSMAIESDRAVVASTAEGSSAARAGIRAGDTITAINDEPVSNWFDIHRIFATAEPNKTLQLQTTDENGQRATRALTLGAGDLQLIRGLQYAVDIPLREHLERRHTTNPFVAIGWGARETRDLIVQFYVVLKRMSQNTISPSNLSGPAGIFHHGIRLATRGTDWMVWYLAMISANLAVVNFLPLPIVDGGHFVFLLIEKIRGRPAPPKVMLATQLVGLALIVGLFLFVTYNDIMRML